MADVDWRVLARRWEGSRGDQLLLEQVIQARRRVGLPPSRRLLDGRLRPGREFDSRLHLQVWAQLPDGRVEELGRTPRWLGRPLQIPPHRRWWVKTRQPLYDADLREVARELRLREVPGLELEARRVTDVGLRYLSEVEGLTTLLIKSGRHVTDVGAAYLTRLEGLTHLYLWGCAALTDRSAEALSGLRALTTLELPGSQLADRGAEALAELRELTELSLTSSRITDVGLAALARLPGLAALDLDVCRRISGVGLQSLSGLSELVKLNLLGCRQIDDEALEHLGVLGNLRLLIVSPGIGNPAIVSLRRRIPDLVVRQSWDPAAWIYYPWDDR